MLEDRILAAKSNSRDTSLGGAESLSLSDFTAALSSGVLRATSARQLPGLKDWRPWIWAGWIIGDGPFGPFGSNQPNEPPSGPGGALTVRDHTIVMEALLSHPLELVKALNSEPKDNVPSPEKALRALLQLRAVDDYTKSRIALVLKTLPLIERARASAPEEIEEAIAALSQKLKGQSVDRQLEVLQDSGLRSKFGSVPGILEGMNLAADVLVAGRDTIYAPDYGFYEVLNSSSGASSIARDAASDISSADTIATTAGAAIGSLVPGLGTVAGGVASGAGGSIGAALAHLWDWIWD